MTLSATGKRQRNKKGDGRMRETAEGRKGEEEEWVLQGGPGSMAGRASGRQGQGEQNGGFSISSG